MNTDKSKSTMLVISMGFLILYILFSWKWALIVSLIVGIIGIASNFLSKKIEWGWIKSAQLLSNIITPVLLSVVFYLFLLPIAIISRMFTKDPLMLSNKYKTYFVLRKKEFNKKDFEKTW